MPSKKTSSTDKASKAKKSSAKKSSSAKKAPSKKTPAKKTTKGTKTAKTKKPAGTGKNRSAKKTGETPIVFKSLRRAGPATFTIEDVRIIIKKRAKEAEKAKAEAPQPVKVEAPKIEVKEIPVAEPRNSRHNAASLDDILGLSSPARKSGNAIAPEHQKYYDLLIELRDQVSEELNQHSNDTLKRSQKEDSGEKSTSVDAGSDTFDRDFALSLLSSEQEALNEIESAIRRIHQGNYGVCEITGKPIASERLEAVPFTRFSLEGQRQHELTVRKRVSRTGAFIGENTGDVISFGDDDGDN